MRSPELYGDRQRDIMYRIDHVISSMNFVILLEKFLNYV